MAGGFMIERQAQQRGFSLVEVLLALFLLGLGVLATAPMFIFAQRSNATGGDYGKLAASVVERLETLRAQDYATLAAGGDLASDIAGFSDPSNPEFRVRWEIVDNLVPENTKTITVRSESVRDVLGGPKQFSVSALRAR